MILLIKKRTNTFTNAWIFNGHFLQVSKETIAKNKYHKHKGR